MELGITFEHAIAHAPHTNPSHMALFQSRLPSDATDDQPMLAQVLAAHGYRTAAFTGGGHVSAKFGFGRGFESYDEDLRGFGSTFGAIEAWVRGIGDQSFFLFLHTYDIHLPYDPPAPFDSMYTAADYDGPVRGENTRDLAHRVRRRKEYADYTGPVDVPDPDRRQYSDLYDGGIRYTDQYIVRLMSLLREEDLWDRTILVVLSDHGEEFWDHGSVSHGHTLFQELIHVPLVFHVPGREGRRISTTVGLVDVAPTILELVDIEAPKTFLGRSLVRGMDGSAALEDGEPVSEINRQRSLIRDPWKIILDLKTGDLSLFNMESDPGETMNVASEQPEIAAGLRARLLEIVSGHEDKDLDMDAAAEAVRDVELRKQLSALGYVED
jgi:arylsulfatase A-like enzyme